MDNQTKQKIADKLSQMLGASVDPDSINVRAASDAPVSFGSLGGFPPSHGTAVVDDDWLRDAIADDDYDDGPKIQINIENLTININK